MKNTAPDGNAIVYCEGAFGTANGKTAHGLVRRTNRYRVLAVVDSTRSGRDAGDLLDGRANGVSIHSSVGEAIEAFRGTPNPATHLVVGLAPDGGRLEDGHRQALQDAVEAGLHLDSGLHTFLSEDPVLSAAARERGVQIRDIRKPPSRAALHSFTGKISEVRSVCIAVLGTDSAVGKRTTAWILVDALEAAGYRTELIGTGQTAWMQGVRYGIVLDSIINDFVAGEIEHAVWSAWEERHPDVIVLEGQGSLMNPAYPGGFELLAAGRPDGVILQHAPARKEYDGFPGYPIHPLDRQIQAIELISEKPVLAVTVNHEQIPLDKVPAACAAIEKETGLPAFDLLVSGGDPLVAALEPLLARVEVNG